MQKIILIAYLEYQSETNKKEFNFTFNILAYIFLNYFMKFQTFPERTEIYMKLFNN